MGVRDDPGPSGPYIDVDIHSMVQAAGFIDGLGDTLTTDVTTVRKAATDGLGAIPPSDLYNAYAFCWGRWSQVFEDAHKALSGTALAAKTSAGILHHVDKNAMPPGPGVNRPH